MLEAGLPRGRWPRPRLNAERLHFELPRGEHPWDLGPDWVGLDFGKSRDLSPLGAETFFRIRPDGSARPPTRRPTPSTFVSRSPQQALSALCVCVCVCVSAVLLPPLLRNPFFFLPKGVLPGGGTETRDSLFLFSPSSTEQGEGGSQGVELDLFSKGPRNVSSPRTFPPLWKPSC